MFPSCIILYTQHFWQPRQPGPNGFIRVKPGSLITLSRLVHLRRQYDIIREACDEYAISSQTRWSSAHAAGAFNEEMAPIEVKTKKGPKVRLPSEEFELAWVLNRIKSISSQISP